MKITVKTADGKDFLLAGLGSDAVSDFRKNGRPIIQAVQKLRAAEQEFFERGNKKTSITFSITREHRTVREAEIFVLEHDDKVPVKGLMTFSAQGAAGTLSERYLQAACINAVESRFHGQTTFHSYEIWGGELLSKKPRPEQS